MRNHLLFIALMGLLMGCQNGPPPVATSRPATAELSFEEDAVWQACLDVLWEYDFRVDRQDRRDGVITTYPLTGKSWFEFARKDAATTGDALESTVQTICRTVEIHIAKDEAGKCLLSVTARTSRSDRPELQVTNSSQAHEMFLMTQRRRSLKERRAYGEDVMFPTVPLGEDAGLAEKIRGDIEKKLAERPQAG
jgi:hypothetical protein